MADRDPLQRDLQLQTVAKGFDEPAKVPCKGCPLRTEAVRGSLGGWTPMMYLEALHGPADIACHMSKHFDGHVEARNDPDAVRPRSCTGVAAYRANTGGTCAHPLSSASIAVATVAKSPEALADAFASPSAFLLHHEVPEGRKEDFWRPDRAGCGTRRHG